MRCSVLVTATTTATGGKITFGELLDSLDGAPTRAQTWDVLVTPWIVTVRQRGSPGAAAASVQRDQGFQMNGLDPGAQQVAVQGHDVLSPRQAQRGLRECAAGGDEQGDVGAVFETGNAPICFVNPGGAGS